MQITLPSKELSKARPPDTILNTYDHFIAEAPGTRLRTHNWSTLREWAKLHPDGTVTVVCDDEE